MKLFSNIDSDFISDVDNNDDDAIHLKTFSNVGSDFIGEMPCGDDDDESE